MKFHTKNGLFFTRRSRGFNILVFISKPLEMKGLGLFIIYYHTGDLRRRPPQIDAVVGRSMCGCAAWIHLQSSNEPLRNGRKYLPLFPDDIHLWFQGRGERAENQAALLTGIHQMRKGQKAAQPFPDKDGAMVCQLERASQTQLIHTVFEPSGQIIPPSPRGSRRN